MAKHVEIVSIGNELLIGKTLNTNAQWLARRITSLGLCVTRITAVHDDVKEIATILREAIARNPNFIFTTGGLGPTFDDLTLTGIAEALDSKLKVDEKALIMVKKKYGDLAKKLSHKQFELTPERIKMATIPEGAQPLPNPIGTAPAIAIRHSDVTVFVLPGVPPEMKAIFENSVFSILKKAAGSLIFVEANLCVSGITESEIAPLIDQVMQDNPNVYIKSHPLGAEGKPEIELHLSTTARDGEVATNQISRAKSQLSEVIKAKDGTTKPGTRMRNPEGASF